MASFFEIYVARHAEQGSLKRRETVQEFRRTIRVVNQDVAKEMFDRIVDLVQIEFEPQELLEETGEQRVPVKD